jgi:hypothetical protein
MHEFVSLLDCGCSIPDVYIYLGNNRSVRRPAPGELSWPVEFVLSKFHSKHIFADAKLAPLSAASIQIVSFTNKLAWISELQGVEENSWRSIRTRPSFTPPCGSASPAILQVCSELGEDLLRCCRKARARTRYHRATLPGVVTYALKLLKKGMYTAVRTDKDGGFTLVHKFELRDLYADLLGDERVYAANPWTWSME